MIKTTRTNLPRRYAGIDWNELPQIFKDAIAVTICLDCRWIWIDSLCIVQDDELDWKEQSIKMAEIYSNSYLNIAATFSPTSFGACFSDRKVFGDYDEDKREWSVESVELVNDQTGIDAGLYVRVAHELGHRYIDDDWLEGRDQAAPLLERAWVFQERLLSSRTLHFGSSELIWECDSSLACECSGISDRIRKQREKDQDAKSSQVDDTVNNVKDRSNKGLKARFADISQNNVPQQQILDVWIEVVIAYSGLLLTKITDRPYALAGIASHISDKLNSKYLAGIWAADLPRALIWSCSTRLDFQNLRSSPTAPTWSWMSHYGVDSHSAVCFPEDIRTFVQDDRLYVHDLGTFCNWTDANPFGGVLSGQIEMTAAVKLGNITCIPGLNYTRFRIQVESFSTGLWVDYSKDDRPTIGQEVLCLLVGTTSVVLEHVLVLKPPYESKTYTRVGVAEFDLAEGSVFDQAEMRRVRIV